MGNSGKVTMMQEEPMVSTKSNRNHHLLIAAVIVVISLCIGVGIGFAVGKKKYENTSDAASGTQASQKQLEDKRIARHKLIFNSMKAENIKENLRKLTSLPHYPGGPQSKKIADEMMTQWKTQGFDKTESFKYNIYLSYPTRAAEISLKNGSVVANKLIIDNEPSYDDSEKGGKILLPFNAFSAAGTVTGELVYGNYGRDSDFDALKNAGIEVKGKVMLFRYGKTSRTMKVKRSEERGVLGVIIFSDPADYSSPGMEYPNGWMLNRYGVQRGTVNRLPGDALSIGYPSKDNYFRYDESKYEGNPAIPSQPISYSTAYEILSWMSVAVTNASATHPDGFQGGMNFTYPLRSGVGRWDLQAGAASFPASFFLERKERQS